MFWPCSIGYSNFRSFTEGIFTLWNHFRDGMAIMESLQCLNILPSWELQKDHLLWTVLLGCYPGTSLSTSFCASRCSSPFPNLVGERGGRRTKYDKNLSHSHGIHIICVKQLGLELLFWNPCPPVPVIYALLSESSMSFYLPVSDTMLQRLRIYFSNE